MIPGAEYLGNNNCEFTVWAPFADDISLKITKPTEQVILMKKNEKHYWKVKANNIIPGTKYFYKINNDKERPDPASNFQPDDVHGPSQVIDHTEFKWTDNEWKGISIDEAVFYEIHTGTFTTEGTFEAAISRIDDLKDLGISAIEIMPVSQFPDGRNWGYDGTYVYAPDKFYGSPDSLKKLINACHEKNIAVVLDLVYNHFGPEGNYANEFGPYFTHKYKTPWGMSVNFDGEYSDEVRNFFISNVLFWFTKYHIDGIRLDAIHEIYDMSAKHILQEINENVEKLSADDKKKRMVIAESDLNDVKIIKPIDQGGYGCTAQWSDDFHHAVHSVLTNEDTGYYEDFGKVENIADALRNSFVYAGTYSHHRKRRHGNIANDVPVSKFVINIQNHDQIGNRAFGERLSSLVTFDALKLACATMFLSPYIPLIFMGEEYAEKAPFLFFVSYLDSDLIHSVREGRKKEFSSFKWQGEIPDPQSESTFLKSKLNWNLKDEGNHKQLRNFYKELLRLRKTIPALKYKKRRHMEVTGNNMDKVITLKRWKEDESILALLNYNSRTIDYKIEHQDGDFFKILDSADAQWNGSGSLVSDKLDLNENKIILKDYQVVLFRKGKIYE